MNKKAARSVAAVAMQRAGIRKGYRALLFIACWWITEHELGRDPENVDEYCDNWKQSRATGFREQQAFRRAFPEFATPSDLARAIGFDPVSMVRNRDAQPIVSQLITWAI